jgi:hypothetical protein
MYGRMGARRLSSTSCDRLTACPFFGVRHGGLVGLVGLRAGWYGSKDLGCMSSASCDPLNACRREVPMWFAQRKGVAVT